CFLFGFFVHVCFFFLLLLHPPRSTLFPTRRSSDLCNTATALALDKIVASSHLPVIGVVEPGAERASACSKVHKVVVIATEATVRDRKSTRLNSSHQIISYAVFCLKKKKKKQPPQCT